MSDRKYILPGLDAWQFEVAGSGPMLWHRGGAGFAVTGVMTPEQIAEQVKAVLRQTVVEPDVAAEDAAVQAVLSIDWQAMLYPSPFLIAPLLNAVPAAQRADNTAIVNEIYALLRKLE